jgi:hypothetical protein
VSRGIIKNTRRELELSQANRHVLPGAGGLSETAAQLCLKFCHQEVGDLQLCFFFFFQNCLGSRDSLKFQLNFRIFFFPISTKQSNKHTKRSQEDFGRDWIESADHFGLH